MITVRISENLVAPTIKIKCPNCGEKTHIRLDDEQIADILSGDNARVFCDLCSDGFNLEIEY